MASITWDSELMTNYAEAVSVPSGKKIVACVDDLSKQPAVFSLSNHELPKLQLIRVENDGRRVLINIGSLLSMPSDGIIETFDVRQSQDLTIYLSFSVKIDERHSNLWIVRPFKLTSTLSLSTLPVRPIGRIHDIKIGPYGADGSRYPAVYVMHQPLNRTAENSDLVQVRVSLEANDWEARKDLTLPENVEKILDIAPAFAGFLGHGLIYLCEQNAKRALYAVFVRPGEQIGDRGTAAQFLLPCPEDATSIATFTDYNDNNNRSSLLVGCDSGVRLMLAKELTGNRGISIIMLNQDDCLKGARHLHVSQTEKNLSLFVLNAQEELAFLTTTFADMQKARAAPILPEGSVTSFSAMITAPSSSTVQHSVLCSGAGGNLTWLQQALDTGIWKPEPYFVEAGGEIIPFESYTITLTAKDALENRLVNGKIQLKSASSLPVIINGRSTVLTPATAWYSLDNAGEIGLIIPTKSIATQPITVKGLRDASSKAMNFTASSIDPARKALARMSSLNSAEALSNATSSDGTSIWEGTTKPSNDDLESAAKCFGAIKDAYATLPKDGSVVKATQVTTTASAGNTGNFFMDAFLWLKHKAQKVGEWIIRKAGEVWEFVCEIGGKAMNFVLDCIEKVSEAASWIWDKLKVGWDNLCKFVGFIFNWDDVLETKNTIVSFLNAGLDMAADKVEGLNEKIDDLFAGIRKTVADATGATTNADFTERLERNKKKDDVEMDDFKDSAPSKWVGERMKNGNARTSTIASKATDEDKETADVVDLWKDRLEPLMNDFNTLIEDLSKDIAELFQQDKNASQQALFERLGTNLLGNLLEVVQKLLKAVISIVAKVILLVKSFGNFPIPWDQMLLGLPSQFGFISSFTRWITKGEDLTLFGVISLLIAIPSTVIIKLVTGAKPPTFKEVNAGFVESVIAARKAEKPGGTLTAPSKETMKDVTVMLLGCGCGAALIKVYVKNMKLALKTMTQGAAAGVGMISPAAVATIFGMAVDGISLYKDLVVHPVTDDTPGKELIQIVTAVKCFRLAANAMYMLAAKSGVDNPAALQANLCIGVMTRVINFYLSSAIYVKQLGATSGSEYDGEVLATAFLNTYLETVSEMGYFTAATFAEKAPPVSIIGLVCFQGAALGGVATKGLSFRSEYKRL